jgi:hypothetical protein
MPRRAIGVLGFVTAAAIAMWPVANMSRASAQTPPPGQTPVPRPFPGTTQTQTPPSKPPAQAPAKPTQTPEPAASSSSTPSAAALGAPVYPGATPLDVIDAGQGQRLYLFGTNASYTEIVTYYKNVLKNGGRELFKTPPMQQFDTGKFQDETMTFQPGVVVKDYTWNNSDGYLYVSGTKEQRFKTIIQIVPPTIK